MLLPFRPKPKKDELLSSWLVRLARGYGMGIDCDRIRSAGLLNLLESCTGTERASIEQTLLTTHICLPLATEVGSLTASWSWFIPLGYSRRSTQPVGFQICPHCLASDEPYFRWQWRVALFFSCSEHHCLLIDRCPRCQAAIHPYALSLLGLRRACTGNDGRLESCDQCSFDLREAVPKGHPTDSRKLQEILDISCAHQRALRGGQRENTSLFCAT